MGIEGKRQGGQGAHTATGRTSHGDTTDRRGRAERGTRMAARLGSDGDKRSTAAGREQGETERKKEYVIYLRERRREKRR